MPAKQPQPQQPVHPPQPLPLLQDFYRHFTITHGLHQQQQQQQQVPHHHSYQQPPRTPHRLQSQLQLMRRQRDLAQAPGLVSDKGQTTLILTPNPELTRRYYRDSSRDNRYDKPPPAESQPHHCKRYPFSQVIYPNLVRPDDSSQLAKAPQPIGSRSIVSKGTSALSTSSEELKLLPGALTMPAGRSPNFIHRQRVRRSRSTLEHALTSRNSQEEVVQKAIDQLKGALILPIASAGNRLGIE